MNSVATERPVWLVVPCFNEAQRFSVERFGELASDPRLAAVFVDDGSSDDTSVRLHEFAAARSHVTVLVLESNLGKGEAVRAGIIEALRAKPEWVGYVDADLATPVCEIVRLVDLAVSGEGVDVIIGSRVAMLGRRVRRSMFRHYTGRVFATGASIVLGKPVYDTQCGAKLFRAGPALEAAVARPFRSRWAFDVELLGRLDREGVAADAFREEPLEIWQDEPASKRSLLSSVRATLELLSIRRDLARWHADD